MSNALQLARHWTDVGTKFCFLLDIIELIVFCLHVLAVFLETKEKNDSLCDVLTLIKIVNSYVWNFDTMKSRVESLSTQ